MEKIWTILDVVNWGTEYFGTKGVDSPRLTIELLVCEVLNIDRINIYSNYDKPLIKEELDMLHSMIVRRAKREPIQYIIGKTDFLDLEIKVNNNVLIPRPETELLVDFVINSIDDKDKRYRILEIGTGSGCIALQLGKSLPNSRIMATDISEKAINVALDNACDNAIENVIFKVSDIMNELPDDRRFDIVVSNPPYIPKNDYVDLEPEVKDFEPSFALTDAGDGLSFYHRFAEIFGNLLTEDGMAFLELDSNNADMIQELFFNSGFVTFLKNDLSSQKRFIRMSKKQ